MPGSVPLVWLTRTPPIPLGTTTIPSARRIGPQASRARAIAARQWTAGAGGTGAPPGVAANCWCFEARYRSRASMAIAVAIIPTPPHSSKYLNRTITSPFNVVAT